MLAHNRLQFVQGSDLRQEECTPAKLCSVNAASCEVPSERAYKKPPINGTVTSVDDQPHSKKHN